MGSRVPWQCVHFHKLLGSFSILSRNIRKLSELNFGGRMLLMCMQDRGASVAVETPQASDSEVSLGGLPICRSLTRRKSVPNRAPAPRCAQPPSREGSANGNPVAAAAAAAAMSFNHGQCSRRQSRLMTLSSVSTTQVDIYTDHASLHGYYKGGQTRWMTLSSVPTILVDN